LYTVDCSIISLELVQRIFKRGDKQHTCLPPDKTLNDLINGSTFYVIILIIGTYKLIKSSRFFGPPCR